MTPPRAIPSSPIFIDFKSLLPDDFGQNEVNVNVPDLINREEVFNIFPEDIRRDVMEMYRMANLDDIFVLELEANNEIATNDEEARVLELEAINEETENEIATNEEETSNNEVSDIETMDIEMSNGDEDENERNGHEEQYDEEIHDEIMCAVGDIEHDVPRTNDNNHDNNGNAAIMNLLRFPLPSLNVNNFNYHQNAEAFRNPAVYQVPYYPDNVQTINPTDAIWDLLGSSAYIYLTEGRHDFADDFVMYVEHFVSYWMRHSSFNNRPELFEVALSNYTLRPCAGTVIWLINILLAMQLYATNMNFRTKILHTNITNLLYDQSALTFANNQEVVLTWERR